MKTKMKLRLELAATALVATTALLTTSSAYAQGDKTGGGGDILTCIENGAKNHYLLDMYEGKVRGEKISLGSETLSIEEKIALVQSRYSELDSVRAARYAEEALKLAADIKAIEMNQEAPHKLVALYPIALRDIDDADENFSAKNCTKAQMVRQEKPIHFNDRYYTFDSQLWNLLNNDQKVATLYHEVIYKELRESGINVSKGARSLNRLLMSGEISKMSELSYIQLLKSIQIKSYVPKGSCNINMNGPLNETISNATFDSAGKLTSMNCSRELLLGKGFGFELSNFTFSNGIEFSASAWFFLTPYITIHNDTLAASNEPDLNRTAQFTMIHPNLFRFVFEKVKGGVLIVQTDAMGKVLSRETDTDQYTVGVNSKISQVNAVLECARHLVQRKKLILEAEVIIQALRQAMPNENEAVLNQLLTTCQNMVPGQYLTSVQTIEPVVREIVSGFSQPVIRGCEGSVKSLNVGVLAAIGVGFSTASCTLSDGSRRFYFGPTINFSFGVGFNALSQRLPYKNRIGKKDHAISMHSASEFELMIDPYGDDFGRTVLGVILEKESTEQRIKDMKLRAVGVSLEVPLASVSPTFRLFRQKDNWNLVVNHLIQNLTYSKK